MGSVKDGASDGNGEAEADEVGVRDSDSSDRGASGYTGNDGSGDSVWGVAS